MFAVITTDEYKELISAKEEGEQYMMAYTDAVQELKAVRESLDNLLLLITKGEKKSRWQDGNFEDYDLESKDEIAEYINKNFMKDGRLTVKENNNA
jgi:hypothetical protein